MDSESSNMGSQPEGQTIGVEENGRRPSYIVGIGASAGGLEALEKFFRSMPVDSGIAFVVVQHLSPDFKSLMDELLARYTTMDIHRVHDGIEIEADAIYLIPPRKDMVLVDGRLHLSDVESRDSLHLSIDTFFRSLAHEAQERAIAIVLSGTGSDGSRSLQEIHQYGGLIIIQDPSSAGFDGMPRNAISTGLANIICIPEAMPEHILRHIAHPSTVPDPEYQLAQEDEEDEIAAIFSALHRRFQIDFTQYKLPTIMRRIDRRMMMVNIGSAQDYLRHLLEDPNELDSLYRDLLIEVTVFFRDEPAFDQLKSTVIPDIFGNLGHEDHIRIWVPGCATGEEAYSLAMLFREAMEQFGRVLEIKLFATDVHQSSIEAASAGLYSETAVKSVPEPYLQKYFRKTHDGYQIRKTLRQMVVFANHNLVQDPPFTRLDLISCRNVLIYLQNEAQQKILSRFHFGLKTGGFLFLGPSENIGDLQEEFEAIDRRWRIFRKRRDGRVQEDPIPLYQYPVNVSRYVERQQRFYSGRSNITYDWYDTILDRFVPDGFLVNESFDLVHTFGNGRTYLTQPTGQATLYVLRHLHGDLLTAVRTALHRATKEEEPVSYTGIRATINDVEHFLKISVSAVHGQKQDSLYYLITISTLEEAPPLTDHSEELDVKKASSARLIALERELQYTKEYLQTTIEELETANEEMQSANEELLASNQELQSTNEELHAVNEELYTVNAEHQRKIDELLQLNNDIVNLQRNSQVSIIFLDPSLQIRQFTPAAATQFNLLPQDIGRPVSHLLYNLNIEHQDLLAYTTAAMEKRESTSLEISLPAGQRLMMHIRPYLTETDQVEGVVLTYHDITALKKAEFRIQYQSLMQEHVSDAIIITDLHFVIQEWSGAAELIYGWSSKEAVGQPMHTLLQSFYLDSKKEYVQRQLTEKYYWQGNLIQRSRSGQELFMKSTCSIVLDKGNNPISIVSVNSNLTEEKLAKQMVTINETLLTLAADIAGLGVFNYSLPPGNDDAYSERWANILGYSAAELPPAAARPEWFQKQIHADDLPIYRETINQLVQGHTDAYKIEFRVKTRLNNWVYLLENGTVIERGENGRFTKILGVIQDITQHREREIAIKLLNTQLEDQVSRRTHELNKANKKLKTQVDDHEKLLETLRTNNEKYNHILELSSEGVWIIDASSQTTYVNQRLADMLGYPVEEVLKRPYHDFMEKSEQEKAAKIISGLKPGVTEEHDFTFKHQKGSDIWTLIAVKPLTQKDGSFNGAIATITDITRWHNDETRIKNLNNELKEKNQMLEQMVAKRTAELDQTTQSLITEIQERTQSESTLKMAEAKFEALLSQAPTAIVIADAQGNIQLLNDKASQVLGFTFEELNGRPLTRFIPEDQISEFTKTRRQLLQTASTKSLNLDLTLRRKDGTAFPAQLNIASINLHIGRLIACFIIDISSRKLVEDTLTAQATSLEKSNEELQNFAYIVSHDLRAPLRALNTYSRFLIEDYDDELDEDAREYIAGIAESAKQMDALIAGLLAYARIDRPIQKPVQLDVKELLHHLVNNLNVEDLASINMPEAPAFVWAHEAQLQQIFTHLIDNSLKFVTPAITPIINIDWIDQGNFVEFSVSDNGIGIEERYFDKIFGIFQRLHTYDEYPGIGIGLAIVKKSIEKHGGKIQVESTPGKGSTFTFTMPKGQIGDHRILYFDEE